MNEDQFMSSFHSTLKVEKKYDETDFEVDKGLERKVKDYYYYSILLPKDSKLFL